jgi:glutathione peroxidase
MASQDAVSLHPMRLIAILFLPVFLACSPFDRVRVGPVSVPAGGSSHEHMSFHQLTAIDINGNTVRMDRFAGKKIMVVNTASECGYTPQYRQLQELYDLHKDQGLVVLGFPSNDFGGQEPGTEQDIAAFCEKNYGVSFPMMAKVTVKGADAHPVFQWLQQKQRNGVKDAKVDWNFNKFLIDEQGRLVEHLSGKVSPLDDRILDWVRG